MQQHNPSQTRPRPVLAQPCSPCQHWVQKQLQISDKPGLAGQLPGTPLAGHTQLAQLWTQDHSSQARGCVLLTPCSPSSISPSCRWAWSCRDPSACPQHRQQLPALCSCTGNEKSLFINSNFLPSWGPFPHLTPLCCPSCQPHTSPKQHSWNSLIPTAPSGPASTASLPHLQWIQLIQE